MYLKLLQKLALSKKKKKFLGFTGFQVEGVLVPSCGFILEGRKAAMRGWAAGLWVTEMWPWDAAFSCAGAHKACLQPLRLLQSCAPVYHRPAQLQAICLAAISQAPCANKDGPCLCELSFPEQAITNKATNLRRRNGLCAQLGGFRSSH